MGVADITETGVDTVLTGVFAIFPLMIGFIMLVFFVTKIVFPILEDGRTERNMARIKKEKAQADSDKLRALVTRLVGLRSDFDDWLVDGLLVLEIECAAHPGEPKRVELLDELERSKDNNSNQIERLHSGYPESAPTTAELADIQHEWDNLRNRLSLLPHAEAISAA
jgi:hypothetical protein